MSNNVSKTLRTFSCTIDSLVKRDLASAAMASWVSAATSSSTTSPARTIVVVVVAAGVGIHGRGRWPLMLGCRDCRSIGPEMLNESNGLVTLARCRYSEMCSNSCLRGTAGPAAMPIEIGVAAEITGVSMMARAAASMTLGDFAFLSTLGVPVFGVGGLRGARMFA